MNHYVYYLLTMACIVAGCQKRPVYDAALLFAEQQMHENADTAFLLVYEKDSSSAMNDADRALYGLLYTEALHKKGVFILNDSLVGAALSYFETTADRYHEAKSSLHLGITQMNNDRLQAAVASMKRAEKLSRRVADDALSYDVNEALGELNRQARCRGLMIRYLKQSMQWAESMGSSPRKAKSLLRLMRAYEQMGENDSAALYIPQAMQLQKGQENTLRAGLLATVGSLCLSQGDTAKAALLLREAFDAMPDDYVSLRMGDLCARQGDMKQALKLWFFALNTNDEGVQKSAYEQLIAYYEHREGWRALDLSTRLNRLYQRIQFTDNAETIAALQADYDHNVVSGRLSRRLLAAAAACLLLAAVIVGFLVYHRRRMRSYHNMLQHIARLQAEVEAGSRQRQHPEGWELKNLLMDDQLVHRFHQLAAAGKTAQHEQWVALRALIEQAAPGFFPMIHAGGMLSERDANICMLIKLRFQPTEIAALIGASPQTVTNSRVRLLNKIFGIKGGARDFDARIIGDEHPKASPVAK